MNFREGLIATAVALLVAVSACVNAQTALAPAAAGPVEAVIEPVSPVDASTPAANPPATSTHEPAVPVAEPSTAPPAKVPATPGEKADSAGVAAAAVAPKARKRRVAAPSGSGSLATVAQVLAALSKDGSGNVVLSPYGFELAGDLLLAGAAGATRQEWLRALGYPAGATAEAVAARSSKRREALKQDDSATLSTAAAAWSSMQAPLRAEYIERIRSDYGSHAATVDFGDPATLATINGWFSEQTRGRVPTLIDRLSADTHAVLGSALFFKGKWQFPFDPSATRDDAFQSADGEVQVPTMRHRFEAMSYCERNGMQAARLPFVGGHYEMTIVLPAAGKELLPQSLSEWLKPDCYAPQAVEFSMPKLSLQGDASLIDALRAAGLSTALGPKPDYKAMSDTEFVPDRILQKTVLKIDESGAEAAAATAITGTRSLAIAPPAITMAVNRPYHVILQHLPSSTVLVLALVRKPQ